MKYKKKFWISIFFFKRQSEYLLISVWKKIECSEFWILFVPCHFLRFRILFMLQRYINSQMQIAKKLQINQRIFCSKSQKEQNENRTTGNVQKKVRILKSKSNLQMQWNEGWKECNWWKVNCHVHYHIQRNRKGLINWFYSFFTAVSVNKTLPLVKLWKIKSKPI